MPERLLPAQGDEERELHRLGAELAGLEITQFVAPLSEHVVLRGKRFHLLDWGTAGRPPALFLHGGGQTARTWDLCCLAMRRNFHCLALDQRGHGDSEWAYDFAYAPDDHAGDFAALLDHRGVSRAIVIGMSMGCLNGLAFALRHPERVSAFVAVDAGPWVQMEGGRRIVEFTSEAESAAALDDWVAAAHRFNPRRDPRLLRQSLLHNLRVLPDGRLAWKTDRRRPTDLAALETRLAALRSRLGEIRCPVLILRGGESDVFLDADAERFASALPDAHWIRVEGAGHAIQGDRPADLVREVSAFLWERGLA